MINLTYKKVTTTHVEFLRQLRNNPSIRSNVGDGKYTTKKMQASWRDNYKKGIGNTNIRIVFYGTLPIGYVNYSIDEDKEIIEIGASIHPYFHNKGIGKRIYNDLIDRSIRLGYRIRLWVYADNVSAYNLYIRLGFKEIKTSMHSSGREIIVMEYSKLKSM